MTREERRRILGADTIADIREQVAAAPEPPEEIVEVLRRILSRPAGPVPEPAPTAETPAADAA